MRILAIRNNHAIIEVESTELDNIINNYLDLQYMVGYDEGYNVKECQNANMDDDDSKKE